MKRTMVYILALSMLAAALLAGCGETGDNRNGTAPSPDATGILPEMDDLVPDALEPDPQDGEVHDTDGVITDGDNAGGTNDAGMNDGNSLTAGNGANDGNANNAGNANGTNGGNGTGGMTVGNSGTGDAGNR